MEILSVLGLFAPLFSHQVWESATVLFIGAILAPGKRTVTVILRVMGLSETPNFQTYHRVLNRAVWSSLSASRIVLIHIIAVFAPTGPLVMGIDVSYFNWIFQRKRCARW
ncbi:MAG: transposase [Cyanothece sp. SIO1E1]|nr:transposase [Cyanothece sp. SIO1E1]